MSKKNNEIFRPLRGNRGFTLVELMIAIGITGILTAIAVLGYTDFTAKSNDATAMSDAKFLLGVASNVLLDDREILFWHGADEGNVIGDNNDWLGLYVPKLYELSPDVKANVQIFNWEVPADPPFDVSSIWVEASHERGTVVPGGLNGRKTYMAWVDGITGWIWQNF